jgi:uracil-DNA glycosylase
LVAERRRPVAFLLWGVHAQAQARLIDGQRHVIVCSPHPSPLAKAQGKAFEGSRPFSRADHGLVHRGAAPIDWALE